MTIDELHQAINNLEEKLGVFPFTPKTKSYFPLAMNHIAANCFVYQIENEDTKLIREQMLNLNIRGKLIFD